MFLSQAKTMASFLRPRAAPVPSLPPAGATLDVAAALVDVSDGMVQGTPVSALSSAAEAAADSSPVARSAG